MGNYTNILLLWKRNGKFLYEAVAFSNLGSEKCFRSASANTYCVRFSMQAHGVHTEGDVVYVPFPLDCKYGEWRKIEIKKQQQQIGSLIN